MDWNANNSEVQSFSSRKTLASATQVADDADGVESNDTGVASGIPWHSRAPEARRRSATDRHVAGSSGIPTTKSSSSTRSLLVVCPFAAADETYRVVVNPKNPAVAVDRAELARLFMKRVSAWSNLTPVAAVDHERTAAMRAAFSKEVHKKDADAVAAQWATLVYSGRDVPPPVKRSDDEVLEFVRQTPGAVGHVSSAASLQGVKVIALRQVERLGRADGGTDAAVRPPRTPRVEIRVDSYTSWRSSRHVLPRSVRLKWI